MSIPTSDRLRRAALIAPLLLAGCEGGPDFAAAFGAVTGRQGVAQVPLFSGEVQAAGPEGYCIDQQASELSSGFVVLAACPVISSTTTAPRTLGLVTIQFGEGGTASVTGNEDVLTALLSTDAGAALLVSGEGSLRGDVERAIGAVYAYVEDTAPSPLGAVEAGRWRAFADVNGRLTTVTAYGLGAAPISEAAKFRLAQRAVAALQAANPAPQPAAAPLPAAETDPT